MQVRTGAHARPASLSSPPGAHPRPRSRTCRRPGRARHPAESKGPTGVEHHEQLAPHTQLAPPSTGGCGEEAEQALHPPAHLTGGRTVARQARPGHQPHQGSGRRDWRPCRGTRRLPPRSLSTTPPLSTRHRIRGDRLIRRRCVGASGWISGRRQQDDRILKSATDPVPGAPGTATTLNPDSGAVVCSSRRLSEPRTASVHPRITSPAKRLGRRPQGPAHCCA